MKMVTTVPTSLLVSILFLAALTLSSLPVARSTSSRPAAASESRSAASTSDLCPLCQFAVGGLNTMLDNCTVVYRLVDVLSQICFNAPSDPIARECYPLVWKLVNQAVSWMVDHSPQYICTDVLGVCSSDAPAVAYERPKRTADINC